MPKDFENTLRNAMKLEWPSVVFLDKAVHVARLHFITSKKQHIQDTYKTTSVVET